MSALINNDNNDDYYSQATALIFVQIAFKTLSSHEYWLHPEELFAQSSRAKERERNAASASFRVTDSGSGAL